MYRTVDQIISASKAQEAEMREVVEGSIGDFCDALRGFIDTAIEWKVAADKAFDIDIDRSTSDLSTARSVSLSILTNRTMETARDIARLLQTGATIPAMVSWRILSETKNIALLIDLDVSGTAGFLWLHYGVIEQAKMMGQDRAMLNAIARGKQLLLDAGFKYDIRKRDPWALGIDGKTHANAVERASTYGDTENFLQRWTKRCARPWNLPKYG